MLFADIFQPQTLFCRWKSTPSMFVYLNGPSLTCPIKTITTLTCNSLTFLHISILYLSYLYRPWFELSRLDPPWHNLPWLDFPDFTYRYWACPNLSSVNLSFRHLRHHTLFGHLPDTHWKDTTHIIHTEPFLLEDGRCVYSFLLLWQGNTKTTPFLIS